MAIYDILYTESDYFEMEITGVNGIANDVLFDENTLNEIPNVLITDFGFI